MLISRGVYKAVLNGRGNPTEPRLVEAVAKQFAFLLHSALGNCCSSYSFKMTSIFCHQSPYVEWEGTDKQGKRKKCELGDILFIYDENGKGGNALLLQAKKNNEITCNLKDKSNKQYELYLDKPDFSFCNNEINKEFENHKVHLNGLHIDKGMQYLLMFPLHDDENLYRCILPSVAPSDTLIGSEKLSANIADLFFARSGKEFDNSSDDDWSKMINALYKHYSKSNFTREKKRVYSSIKFDAGDKCPYNDELIIAEDEEKHYLLNGLFFLTSNLFCLSPNNTVFENDAVNDNCNDKNGRPFYIFHVESHQREKNKEMAS